MNALAFWCRAAFGFAISVGSIVEFSEGHIIAGFAVLAATAGTLLPLLFMVRRGQRPSPLSSLRRDFDMYTLVAWLRAIVGFFCVCGGFSVIGTENERSSLGLLLVGLFLLSPWNGKVFSYGQYLPGSSVKRPWNYRMTLLFMIRSAGLFFIIGGILSYYDKGYFEASIILMVIGLLLVLVRQIRMLVYGAGPSLPVATHGDLQPAHGNIQPMYGDLQPGAAAGPRSPVVEYGPSAADLGKLSGRYKALQQLDPGKKGIAYRQFLHDLFSLYDFSARSAFLLNDTEVEVNSSFELEGQTYILTARWQDEKSGHDALLMFNGRVEAKSTWARGIFISDAGFTKEGLEGFAHGKRTSIIAMDGKDLELILAGRSSLVDAIKRKARRAVETNHSFVPLHELI
jgi:hypothetical protein